MPSPKSSMPAPPLSPDQAYSKAKINVLQKMRAAPTQRPPMSPEAKAQLQKVLDLAQEAGLLPPP